MISKYKNTFSIMAILIVGNFIAYKLVNIPFQTELVALLSVILLYPVIRWPLFGIYLIFILSPFISYFRRLYYLVHFNFKNDPLIILPDILLIFITFGLFFEFQKKKEEGWFKSKFTTVVFLYFIYMIIRIFLFNEKPIGTAMLNFKYYGPPVLFFFSGLLFGSYKKDIKNIWIITMVIGTTAALYGIKQLHFGYSNAEILWFSTIKFTSLFIMGIARPFAFFQAPVVLADYLQLSIIATVMLYTNMKNMRKYLLLLVIPPMIYAILITSVRSSWIGMVMIFILWYMIIIIKTKRIRILVITIIALSYILFNYISDTKKSQQTASIFKQNMISVSDSNYVDMFITGRASAIYNVMDEHSVLARFRLWREIIIYSKTPVNAIFGRGPGALKADSLYFTYLAELGYPGLIFIILLLSSFIIQGFKIIDTTPDNETKVLATAITVMNIVFSITSLTGTHIHYSPSDMYFWFLNGVLIHLSIATKRNEEMVEVLE